MDEKSTVATVQEEAAIDAVGKSKSNSRTSSAKAEEKKLKDKLKREKRKKRKADKKKKPAESEKEKKEEWKPKFEVAHMTKVFSISYNGTGKVTENFTFFKKKTPVDDKLPVSIYTIFGCFSASKEEGLGNEIKALLKKHSKTFYAKISVHSAIDIDCFYTVDVVIDFALNDKKERQIYSIGEYFGVKSGSLGFGGRANVIEGVMEKYRGWDMQFQIEGEIHFIKPPLLQSPAPARLVHLRCEDDRMVPVDASLLGHFSRYFKSLFSSPSTEGFYTMETDPDWDATVTLEDIGMLQRVMTSKEVSPDEAGRIAEMGCALGITPELKRMAEMQICERMIEDISCYPRAVFQLLPIASHIAVTISKREDIKEHIKEITQSGCRGFLKKAGIETAYLFPLLQRVAELESLAKKKLDEEVDEEVDEE